MSLTTNHTTFLLIAALSLGLALPTQAQDAEAPAAARPAPPFIRIRARGPSRRSGCGRAGPNVSAVIRIIREVSSLVPLRAGKTDMLPIHVIVERLPSPVAMTVPRAKAEKASSNSAMAGATWVSI